MECGFWVIIGKVDRNTWQNKLVVKKAFEIEGLFCWWKRVEKTVKEEAGGVGVIGRRWKRFKRF